MNSDLRQYAWIVAVTLVTDDGYDFDQNIERIQKSIAPFGVLVGRRPARTLLKRESSLTRADRSEND